jgi:pimeloyl-ACP methyl ester carboxylesterase
LGHGDSAKPETLAAYAAPLLAQQVAQQVRQQVAQQVQQSSSTDTLQKVTVVAHSWAAKVALLWAQQDPDLVRQVVLVDPFFVNRFPRWLRFTVPWLYRTLPFLKVMGPFSDWGAAIALAQTLKQYRGWSPLQQAVFAAAMVQTASGNWVSKFTPAARDGIFADTFATDGLVTTLTTPSLLILPAGGLNRSPLQTRPYRRYLTHLTPVSVPGNHWPHLVAPEPLVEAIAAHL